MKYQSNDGHTSITENALMEYLRAREVKQNRRALIDGTEARELTTARSKAAAQYSLPFWIASFLTGDTEQEIYSDARKIRDYYLFGIDSLTNE